MQATKELSAKSGRQSAEDQKQDLINEDESGKFLYGLNWNLIFH